MTDLPKYRIISSPYRVNQNGKPSKRFYIAYKLAGESKVFRAPAGEDKAESRQYQVRYVEDHIRKTTGTQQEHPTDLDGLLDRYAEVGRAAGLVAQHIRQRGDKIGEIFRAHKWTKPSQLNAHTIAIWLGKQRESGRHSDRTSWHWRNTIRAFSKWLVSDGVLPSDPLANLKGPKEMKPVFARRAMTALELDQLFTTVKAMRQANPQAIGRTAVTLIYGRQHQRFSVA